MKDKDLLWSTVAMYYAEYYALYSFMQKIGLKCENHSCSIVAAATILGSEMTKTIEEHKEKRIDAQYFMKIDQEDKVRNMLQEAKIFVSAYDEIISKINDKEIVEYIGKIIKN